MTATSVPPCGVQLKTAHAVLQAEMLHSSATYTPKAADAGFIVFYASRQLKRIHEPSVVCAICANMHKGVQAIEELVLDVGRP